ncbi:MAG: bifunctional phosphoglucose/phosphomannose isomerase [Chloroflexi bacterium]|nr:bifunctional phosphoglucose/phosphomannose isomerase [Chloroflexota bacterium]
MIASALDDRRLYQQYDPSGMVSRIGELSWQCQQAWQMAMSFDLPEDYSEVEKVIILGMGGSAIGGDLAASLIMAKSRAPIIIQRDYHLPGFVDEKTLVIASSYSGNTEETLTAFTEALETGARKLAITTGGKLKALAGKAGIPVFIFDYPAQPRAALGFSLVPILCFLQKLGLAPDRSAEVAETVTGLEELSARIKETAPLADNQAKQLAQYLHGSLPVVYGSGLLSEVAHRWKTQINENSKAWAFHEVLPELNHNAVVGYQFPQELIGRIRVLMLRSPLLDARVQLRYRVTAQLLEQAGVSYQVVDAGGSSTLCQAMTMVMLGDYMSYYLALLYGIDPSPVKVIDFLKEQLARGL